MTFTLSIFIIPQQFQNNLTATSILLIKTEHPTTYQPYTCKKQWQGYMLGFYLDDCDFFANFKRQKLHEDLIKV